MATLPSKIIADTKTAALDKPNVASFTIAASVLLEVFGFLFSPVYVAVSIWKATTYRKELWLTTIGLVVLFIVPVSTNAIKKNSVLGLLISITRGYILPVIFLRLTLYAKYINIATAFFIFVRGLRSIYSYLAQPPPINKYGSSGKPTNLRILLAGDSFYPKVDGVSTFTTHTIKHMQTLGHTVHVLTSIKGPSPLFKANVTRLPGVTTETIDPHHSITMPIPWLLIPAIFHFKPHIVHVFESVVPFSFGVILSCWILNIPLVISHHTRIDMYGKYYAPFLPHSILQVVLYIFYRSIITLGDVNIAVCPKLMDWLQFTKTPGGLLPELWVSGCDVKTFTPENKTKQMRHRLSKGRPECPLIIYVGRMAKEKDSSEILPIVRELYEKLNGNVRVALIGGGPMKDTLEMEAIDDEFIYFSGFMRDEELYSACKFICCVLTEQYCLYRPVE
jgi:glycosyltransferase involved in cell wall biosynthesis